MVFIILVVAASGQIHPFAYQTDPFGPCFFLDRRCFSDASERPLYFRSGCFLIAHLLYIAAFTSTAGFGFTWWIASCLFLIGFVMSVFLLPHAGK